jgi:hypothetical protein
MSSIDAHQNSYGLICNIRAIQENWILAACLPYFSCSTSTLPYRFESRCMRIEVPISLPESDGRSLDDLSIYSSVWTQPP